MPEYGLIASFSQVIKVRHPTLVNTNSTRYGSTKNWELENGKKIGNIGQFIVYSRYKLETVELEMSRSTQM